MRFRRFFLDPTVSGGYPRGVVDVSCAILENNGRILLCRRSWKKILAGFWEFPGGKVEEGEAPESALVRELDEELGIDILVGSRLVVHRHSYPFGTVVLTAYAAALRPGEKNEIPHMEDHDAAVWMVPSEWKRYRLSPADLPIAKLVAHRYREI